MIETIRQLAPVAREMPAAPTRGELPDSFAALGCRGGQRISLQADQVPIELVDEKVDSLVDCRGVAEDDLGFRRDERVG